MAELQSPAVASSLVRPLKGRRILRWLTIRLGGLLLLTSLAFYGCANRLLLYPSRDPMVVAGAGRIEAHAPSGLVEIWTFKSRAVTGLEPAAFVLHFIGNGSRAEEEGPDIAEHWRNWPVQVWAVNYPGYGASEGSAAMRSLAPAALAAFDALKARAGDRPVFVSGRSMGTTAALYVAAHRPVAGVILHSPPPLRRLIMGRHGWWNLWLGAIPVALGVPRELDSIANAAQLSAPAILILTDADEIVPPKYQQMVFDAYAGPKQAVHYAAGHNAPLDGQGEAEFCKQLQWMWRLAAPTARREEPEANRPR